MHQQQYTKIAAKMLNIMESLGAVEKKGFNSHQRYHYMREVDVMEALKAELIKQKIFMLTSSKLVEIQKKDGKDGKVDFVTTVETRHTFIDSETGEVLNIESVGSGYDSSDKGAAKAITSAFKYAIMKNFMISDEGADIENDGVSEQKPAANKVLNLGGPKIRTSPKQVEKSTEPVKVEKADIKPATIPVEPVVQEAKKEEVKPVIKQFNFKKRTETITEPNF